MTLQVEIARDVINTSDATIIGVLLAVIVILLVAIGMLWKKLGENQAYMINQDKENLKMIYAVTGTVDSFGTNINDIKGITRDNNDIVKRLHTLVSERLKSINHGTTN